MILIRVYLVIHISSQYLLCCNIFGSAQIHIKFTPMNYEKQIKQIPLYNQYDGNFPILVPDYKDKQYIRNFEKLKTIIKNRQYTLVANQLAQLILNKLASNYNAWYVKRMCYEQGILQLNTELLWTKAFLKENVKNFQGWEHRKFLIIKRNSLQDELDYVDQVLDIQQKNYHVWAYKVWLAEHFNLYQIEKQRTLKWLQLDIMNNSVWSFRHFLFTNTTKVAKDLSKQIQFVFSCIDKNKNNMAVWNYLRGWFPSIKLNQFSSQKAGSHNPLLFKYDQFPQIMQFCLKLAKQDQNCLQALITLVHIHSHKKESVGYAESICEILSLKQKQKETYWKWIRQNLGKTDIENQH